MPRSFLDTADLASLRRAGRDGGPAALALACLLHGGVAAHDPDDPEWADRDRVLVDPALPLRSLAGVLEGAGYPGGEGRLGQGPGRMLAEAVRAARASHAAGDVYRVFAVLDAGSLAVGAVWEALLESAAAHLTPLTLLVLVPPTWRIVPGLEDRSRIRKQSANSVLEAAGWRVEDAGEDPAEILGGLDRLLAAGASGPGALVIRSG